MIGLYFLRSGAIPITRDQGLNALRKMGRNAKKAVKENRSMMIFPQGTRVNPGISSKEKPYLLEFFSYIPKQKFLWFLWLIMQDYYGPKIVFKVPNKLRSKCVTIQILPEISPGLSKQEFLLKLENIIETASNKLLKLEK